ncbi:MAG TPA: gliding motility-associated C-terminal domain-containing protein [Hymenobacter sp.]
MPNFYLSLFSRRLLLLVPLLLLLRTSQATHIVGGELDLQYRSGSTYRLTLNLYFDAKYGNPSALDNDLTASIFEKTTNRRMQNVSLPLTSNTFVSYTNPACTNSELSTRRLVYGIDVTLPASVYANPSGYYVAVERCCRNNGITNIVSPGAAGQTFYLEFPAVVRNGAVFINSTPRIFPPLSDYACRNELFYYNFGGQDIDGDSLVYELSTPLKGHSTSDNSKPNPEPVPYSPVAWSAGSSAENQIPGTPTLSIGRTTGRLEVRPTQLGLFVFGIKCSEYRKGEKIGEVRRDFQLYVIGTCSTNRDPIAQALMPGSSQIYKPNLDTLRLKPGSNRCLNLRFTDPDPFSDLTFSLRPVNFTGVLPTFTTVQGTVRAPGFLDTIKTQLCFPTCLDTRGKVYLLDVIVADNGCSLPKRDTMRVAFTAVPDPNAPPTLTTTADATLPLRARLGDLISFEVIGVDPDNDPITLEMAGRSFTPASVGAQFTPIAGSNPSRSRFTWRVGCSAVGRSLYEFVFTVASTPCSERQATSLIVPIQLEYTNAPPVLTSTLPPTDLTTTTIPVVRRPLGGTYEATLTGLDTDRDALVLSATGNGFDLAAMGMSFVPSNGNGQATAAFRWDPSCEAIAQGTLEVNFRLQEASCDPKTITRTVRFEIFNTDTLTFLPANIFTPNGDTKNDFFELPTLPPDFCGSFLTSIKIFSRWGNEVYRLNNRNLHWDGGGLPAGVYYYLIEYTDKKRFRGTVTIAP